MGVNVSVGGAVGLWGCGAVGVLYGNQMKASAMKHAIQLFSLTLYIYRVYDICCCCCCHRSS